MSSSTNDAVTGMSLPSKGSEVGDLLFWKLTASLLLSVRLIVDGCDKGPLSSIGGVEVLPPISILQELFANYATATDERTSVLDKVLRKTLFLLMEQSNLGQNRRLPYVSASTSALTWGLVELVQLKDLLLHHEWRHREKQVSAWIKSVCPSLLHSCGSLVTTAPPGASAAAGREVTSVDMKMGHILDDRVLRRLLPHMHRKDQLQEREPASLSQGEYVRRVVEHCIRQPRRGGEGDIELLYATVTVFGSAATGLDGAQSDVDLMVKWGALSEERTVQEGEGPETRETGHEEESGLAAEFQQQCVAAMVKDLLEIISSSGRNTSGQKSLKTAKRLKRKSGPLTQFIVTGKDLVESISKSTLALAAGQLMPKSVRKKSLAASSADEKLTKSCLRKVLKKLRGPFNVTEAILHARVPVIRFTSNLLGFRSHSTPATRTVNCDLTSYRHNAMCNSAMIRAYLQWDASGKLKQLLLLLKLFAKSHGIADASKGYLSSYAWVLMGLHVMLHHGYLPELVLDPNPATPYGFSLDPKNVITGCQGLSDTPVSVLFYQVVSYFSSGGFDVLTSTATLRGSGETVSKRSWSKYFRWRLSIEDPFECIASLKPRDLGVTLRRQEQDEIFLELFRATVLLRGIFSENGLVLGGDEKFCSLFGPQLGRGGQGPGGPYEDKLQLQQHQQLHQRQQDPRQQQQQQQQRRREPQQLVQEKQPRHNTQKKHQQQKSPQQYPRRPGQQQELHLQPSQQQQPPQKHQQQPPQKQQQKPPQRQRQQQKHFQQQL